MKLEKMGEFELQGEKKSFETTSAEVPNIEKTSYKANKEGTE